MFEQLQDRLSSVLKTIRGQGKITENNISQSMRDVRRALLEADVDFKVAKAFVNRVQEKAEGEKVFTSISPGQQFVKLIQDELVEFLGGESEDLKFKTSGLTVILIAGLQGSGKTTTSAKLANLLKKKQNRKPFLIAADLQRPAAIDQLEVLGRQINVPVFAERIKDTVAVVKAGLKQAENEDVDTILIDTAGRLHVDEELMIELQSIVTIASPDEILYVADGMTGQDAVTSSAAFSEAITVSGIVLTKMDGDSRGGAALSIREVTQKPIKFLGMGESIDAIEVFHPSRLAQRILGMGDVVSLVEKAQDVFDEKSAMQMQKKMLGNTFSLADFKDQLIQIKKMGSISQMMSMIPGESKLKGMEMDDRQLIWIEAIINSMTPTERERPEILNGSRRKRIAKGAGRSVQEVNQLLKQFSQMRTMMKKFGKMGKGKFPIGL
ncbi:MAG: signal recognition particle protein [Candidatus Marinimicrobia bacterium]|nr:signal recognition particle protein [Candidatus Neomarinimicrobiota bacterium]